MNLEKQNEILFKTLYMCKEAMMHTWNTADMETLKNALKLACNVINQYGVKKDG